MLVSHDRSVGRLLVFCLVTGSIKSFHPLGLRCTAHHCPAEGSNKPIWSVDGSVNAVGFLLNCMALHHLVYPADRPTRKPVGRSVNKQDQERIQSKPSARRTGSVHAFVHPLRYFDIVAVVLRCEAKGMEQSVEQEQYSSRGKRTIVLVAVGESLERKDDHAQAMRAA